MDQKAALLRRFPACRERGSLFITTTSGLSITDLGRRSECGHLLAGTHFWNPPHLMPLVEVIRGEHTPDHVVNSAVQLVKSIGKTPVRVNRDVPGFIGNRMLHALWREAISLVELGIASPEDVDLVARLTFGLRMSVLGPLENMDLVGLDLIERIHRYLLADIADNHGPSEYLSASVERGELGQKSGLGFYDWTTRNAQDLVERRDRQIVRQLAYLEELDREG
jgi:3-hydroxybutyryl-CoA dehydrogenase